MKIRALLLASIALVGFRLTSAKAPSGPFDQYGGLTSVTCANATGHFILTKSGPQWIFCTPAGHAFISMSVGGIGIGPSASTKDCQGNLPYNAIVAKYTAAGSNSWQYNWAVETLNRMASWGFNTVGQDAVGWVQPNYLWGAGKAVPSNLLMPYMVEFKPATYAIANYSGDLAEPVKDLMKGLNGSYTTWRGSALPDVFDPKLSQEWSYELNGSSAQYLRQNSPWILALLTDDTDYFYGVGNGEYFPTGHTNANIGYMGVISAPVQTFEKSPAFTSKSFLFSDTTMHSKVDARNPASCSITAPCTLRDFLWNKYHGNIASLNAAWGSNYTSFDSTGIKQSAQLGTGDGQTVTFTGMLKTTIEPQSIQLLVGGQVVAGDCPWYIAACGSKMATNSGVIDNPSSSYITASSINYQTGQFSATFATAETPVAGAAVVVNFITNGWMSGGTGIPDESGSGSWIGTNNFCVEGAVGAAAYAPYFSCVGGSSPNNPKPNANRQTGADLDAWASELVGQYLLTMRTGLNNAGVHVPYFGFDTLGSWSGAPSIEVLEAQGPYVDGIFTGGYAYNYVGQGGAPNLAGSAADFQFITEYLGDKPLMTFSVFPAQPDSAMSCFAGGTMFSTQAARGAEWSLQSYWLLSALSYNGTYPVVGMDWWTWQDFQNENQGLVSIHDNAYDGVEAIIAIGKDQWGYPTGGEVANYGNSISQIANGNTDWQYLILDPRGQSTRSVIP